MANRVDIIKTIRKDRKWGVADESSVNECGERR